MTSARTPERPLASVLARSSSMPSIRPWPAAMAEAAAGFATVGVDLVVFSMRGPYEARLLEPLATALAG